MSRTASHLSAASAAFSYDGLSPSLSYGSWSNSATGTWALRGEAPFSDWTQRISANTPGLDPGRHRPTFDPVLEDPAAYVERTSDQAAPAASYRPAFPGADDPHRLPHQQMAAVPPDSYLMPFYDPFGRVTSPSACSMGELTQATTAPSVSHQDSVTGSFVSQEAVDMMSQYTQSIVDLSPNEERFSTSHFQSPADSVDPWPYLADANLSHVLRGTGGGNDGADLQIWNATWRNDAVTTAEPNATPVSSSTLAQDLQRTSSNQSNKSSASSQSARSAQRRRDHIANSQRSIAPRQAETETETGSSRRTSELIRRPSEPRTTRKKAASVGSGRVQRDKVYCPHCRDRPEGFRGDHELSRHIARKHLPERSVWICVDASPDGRLLTNCKACDSCTEYNIEYNAVAHLRRKHFNPRTQVRDANESTHRRGGGSGGRHPPMDELRPYLKMVTRRNDPNPSNEATVDTQSTQPSIVGTSDLVSVQEGPGELLSTTTPITTSPSANDNVDQRAIVSPCLTSAAQVEHDRSSLPLVPESDIMMSDVYDDNSGLDQVASSEFFYIFQDNLGPDMPFSFYSPFSQ